MIKLKHGTQLEQRYKITLKENNSPFRKIKFKLEKKWQDFMQNYAGKSSPL